MADLSITTTEVIPGAAATILTGTAGANITAGQTVYVDSSDSNTIKLAQDTSTKYAFAGIAVCGAATGQPVNYCSSDSDFTLGASANITVGQVYTLSDTAGGIRPVADNGTGDYVTIVGIGKTTAKIKTLADARLQAGAAKA